ncbi:class I adenylate-forming enzyme family protein [Microbacterium sp. YY-01]|uniref:class I adenylate-forming enzyme family protein n=1 Tax=Microbacterium sp. YY-01 TaxID=3421634 RepID=UPI003D169449
MPLTATVLTTARTHPNRTAIADTETSLSYGELVAESPGIYHATQTLLDQQSSPVASAPEAAGLPIIAVSLDSAYAAARIVAALAGYGVVVAVIDPRWPLEHRIRVIQQCGITLVISNDTVLAGGLATHGYRGTVVSENDFRMLENTGGTPHPAPTVRSDEEPFLLLFSSGTTSAPKAFIKTRGQYRENFAVSSAHLEPFDGVATLAPGPLSYSLTLYALIECLASGGSAHLMDAFSATDVAERIRNAAITRIVAVPAVVQTLIDAARRDASFIDHLELVVTGGANLPASLRSGLTAAAPHTRLISYYGAAEIGFIGDSRDGDGTWISVYDDIDAEVRDSNGRRLADGEWGTLWIRAAACSDGYIATTSSERLRDDDGWATVHDQARRVGSRIQLVGRAGDIAITGGHKVSLAEVEQAFDGFSSAQAVCAVALPHTSLGSVVALVVEGSAPVPKTALQEWARARLAPQFVPTRWYMLDALPRTVGGKVRRSATRDAVLRGDAVRL